MNLEIPSQSVLELQAQMTLVFSQTCHLPFAQLLAPLEACFIIKKFSERNKLRNIHGGDSKVSIRANRKGNSKLNSAANLKTS